MLPKRFILQHGCVVVENHLNMVRPLNGKPPKVSLAAVSAVLNSPIADETFFCISGSVAVSAFELESLPLPSVTNMRLVERMIAHRASSKDINTLIEQLYLEGSGR